MGPFKSIRDYLNHKYILSQNVLVIGDLWIDLFATKKLTSTFV